MDFFVTTVRTASKVCGIVAAALVGLAILVVCQMVVMRYFLNASTIWQTEFVIFSLVGATLVGSPYVLLIKGHVNVDLLPHYLGRRGRFILALLSSLGALTFCALLGWTGWLHFHEALVNGWRTDTVWSLPLWIPYLALPVGIGLLCLQYVADIAVLVSRSKIPVGTPAKGRGERT